MGHLKNLGIAPRLFVFVAVSAILMLVLARIHRTVLDNLAERQDPRVPRTNSATRSSA